MSRGNLRYTEEQWTEQSAKRARWQKGSEQVNTDGVEQSGPKSVKGPARGCETHSATDRVGVDNQATSLAGSNPAPSTSKYRNVKTDGYSSKKEASRAAALRFLQEQGVIRNLAEQVKFVLIPKQDGERACVYYADFAYEEDTRSPMQEAKVWVPVVEDCKGMKTSVYLIKRKLMLMVHKIKVRET